MNNDEYKTIYKNILDKYFDNYSIIEHQIEPFNEFIEKGIPQVIKDNNPEPLIFNVDELSNQKYKIVLNLYDYKITKPIIIEKNDTYKIMTPHNARTRLFSYASKLYINLNIKIYLSEKEDDTIFNKLSETDFINIYIGKIPIMVGSKYCNLNQFNYLTPAELKECDYEKGGILIYNGNEKVVITQERQIDNKILCFKINNKQKWSTIVEIKSYISHKFIPPKPLQVKIINKSDIKDSNMIRVNFPYIKSEIPLFIVFRALGIISDKNIEEIILYDIYDNNNINIKRILDKSIIESEHIKTEIDAKLYIYKYLTNKNYDIKNNPEEIIKIINKHIKNEILPHVGDNNYNKAILLGKMVRKLLLTYLHQIPYDDRDNYINKRFDTPGILLTNLFRLKYHTMINDCCKAIKKEYNNGCWKATNDINLLFKRHNLWKYLKSNTIDQGMKTSIATGNFGSSKVFMKVGIAQILNNFNIQSNISHKRRIHTPTEKTGKLVPPRKLHCSSYGYICPVETPEGASIGILKNLSITSLITTYINHNHIIDIIKSDFNNIILLEYPNFKLYDLLHNTNIYINGIFIGYTFDKINVLKKLKYLKYNGIIHIYTSIVLNFNTNEITINTDAGRCIRPLYIVKNNKINITENDIYNIKNNFYKWDNLICKNISKNYDYKNIQLYNHNYNNTENNNNLPIIEFLDILESSNILIAKDESILMNNKNNTYLYCEIHSCLILGFNANLIPFTEFNQSPRNTYQSAMCKQAVGIYATNYPDRMDTIAHILYRAQPPIVNSYIAKYINNDNLCIGRNICVAILAYTGCNQEDSQIVNQSAINRGLFLSESYKTHTQKEEPHSFDYGEKICIPDSNNTIGLKSGNYSKLGPDGFIKEGVFVQKDDVIIGKVIPNEKKNQYKYKDSSIILRNNDSGIVDKILYDQNNDGNKFIKTKINTRKTPEIGDKFSSRHGQKGTIGMTFSHENMPFTKDGIIPEFIINPHAIPSRMTIGQLVETNFSVLCANYGCTGESTAFSNINPDDISKLLEEAGLNKNNNHILYSPQTGKPLKAHVFMGTTYYQRLKHIVSNKIHHRAHGPMVKLTRQPAEGRTRDGGLRCGEMERDCIIAHGLSNCLIERLKTVSDNYIMHVCKKCGLIASVNHKEKIFHCTYCLNTIDFMEIRPPYCAKLLLQELYSMAIVPRIF